MNEEDLSSDDVGDFIPPTENPEPTPMPDPEPEVDASMFSIPDLDMADFTSPDDIDDGVKNQAKGSSVFAIIGSGQCGNKMATAFYKAGHKKSLAVNTAPQDLSMVDMPDGHKYLMDIGSPGSAKDQSTGHKAAKEHSQNIFNAMRRLYGQCDYIVVCSSSGGGTGSGSLEIVIEVARKYMEFLGKSPKRVVVYLALPTKGENKSGTFKENTSRALSKMNDYAESGRIGTLLVVDNGRIGHMYRNVPPNQYWEKVNGAIVGLFDIFNRLSSMSSKYTSFDPAEHSSILECGGFCINGVARVKDVGSVAAISEAISNNVKKTLLVDGFDLSTATTAACIAVGGSDVMSQPGVMQNLEDGFETIHNLIGNGAKLHRGIYENPHEKGLTVYTMIGGLRLPKDLKEFYDI